MDKSPIFILLLTVISLTIIPLISYQAFINLDMSQKKSDITKKTSISTLSVLIVLIELPDDPHHSIHTTKHYEDLFFSDNPLSIHQYYQNVSYGNVFLTGEVLGWYQANNELSYYGAGSRLTIGGTQDSRPDELAFEAFNHAINAGKNPLTYDLFVIIHSGDGQEYSGNSNDIWSHQWSLWRYELDVEYSMNHEYVDYSTPSHELGHALHFPDLYDHLYYQNIFAGPYCMMDGGDGHFSIWNKYYSYISRPDSPQLLSGIHRLKISNLTDDSFVTLNPTALRNPTGYMWLEIGWNNSGFINPEHGRGWTVTVRENLDYDVFLPMHGVVIAEIQVGPRSLNQAQVSSNVYPPWDVVDAHPETEKNKDDAAFSLNDGEISTYSSGLGWAIQLIERYENKSYKIRVTNETNIPIVKMNSINQSISGTYDISIIANASKQNSISLVQLSIDNGPWQNCSPVDGLSGVYSYSWDTTKEREGSHLIRSRANDNVSTPYTGYSNYTIVEVDNRNGSILVVDDDLGRFSEIPILDALDKLGLLGEYEVIQTSSFYEAEVSTEELLNYKYIIWIGNPEITPISNSHINYNEFKEIKDYLLTDQNAGNSPRIIFMSSYNIFDFSNQGTTIHNEIAVYFRARSPKNFRAPVSLLTGYDFLKDLPIFTLGANDSLYDTRRSDGEVVNLLSGAIPILEDTAPEFPEFTTKGYYVDDGNYKLINYLFQPELVPEEILPQLIDLSFAYLDLPNNATILKSTTTSYTNGSSFLEIDPILLLLGTFSIIGIGSYLIIRKVKSRSSIEDSFWLKRKENN